MKKESTSRTTTRNNLKQKKCDKNLKKRKIESSSSDSSEGASSSDEENENENEEISPLEYKKLLSELFPSKHIDKQIDAADKLKRTITKRISETNDVIKNKKRGGDDDSEKHKSKMKTTATTPTKSKQTSDKNVRTDAARKESKNVVIKKDSKKISKTSQKPEEESESSESEEAEIEDEESSESDEEEESESSESGEEEEEEEDDEPDTKRRSKRSESANNKSAAISSKSSKNDANSKSSNNYNIIFTIGEDQMYEDDEDDSDWETDEDDDDEEDEDEDVDVSDSGDSESGSESDCSDSCESGDEDEEDDSDDRKKSNKSNKYKSSKSKALVDKTGVAEKHKILKENEDVLQSLKLLQNAHKDNKMVENCVNACETIIGETKAKQLKQTKKQKSKNSRIFKKQLRENNTMNDYTFFNKMEIDEQKVIIKELRKINGLIKIEKPYRLTLLESTMPDVFKAAAMKRVNSLKHMEQGSGEFYKIKNWVDTFMKIPFGKYETLPINMADGVDCCHNFMEDALKKLDKAVYGLNDAKMQIMQMLGQLITNPSAIGTSIAIKGAMGTGKTSLVKEGISKILNRPFAFIALGGATDSTFLEGHSYTYEGSTWGKIVQILIDSKCMNPVIYFDELDKISDTAKGEEIVGILTHLTDSSQNSQFHDKYFSDVDFDLSKCLFIFSYNDESKINPILRDRMYKIQTKGYDKKQKTIIANQYLLPTIREQVKFNEESIVIQEDALHHIIETHCNKEEGVRNLKRCLEIVYTKLNLYRLMRSDTNLFEQEISLKVEFPFIVTKEIVDKLIKPTSETGNETWRTLYN